MRETAAPSRPWPFQPIDTTSPQGKLFFTILAAFAEFERDLIRERTRDGLAATTARGRNGGRKARLTEEQKVTARKLRADGHSIREIGQLLGNGKPVSRRPSTGPWECCRHSRAGRCPGDEPVPGWRGEGMRRP